MRFMMLVRATKETEAGTFPPNARELFAAMARYNEEMVKAGVMLAADGLLPSSKGARVRFSGGKPSVTDGPFTETKELISGYWLIQVRSKEEAIEWASRVPFDEGEIEVRQVSEASDFPPDVFPPEAAEREEAMRAELRRRSEQQTP
jgi:hypothetical protein